jgi:hypothetical protein
LRSANAMYRLHTVLFSTEDKACAGITARVAAPGDPHALAGGKPLRVPPCTPLRKGQSCPFGAPRLPHRPACASGFGVLPGTPRRGACRRRQMRSAPGPLSQGVFVAPTPTTAHSAHRDQPFRAMVIARSGHRDRSEATLAWSIPWCWVPFAWRGPLALSGGPGGRVGRRWRRRGWDRPGSRAIPWAGAGW